jgi:hypothetical protein
METKMKAEALVRTLAERLKKHIPEEVQVRPDGEALMMVARNGDWARVPLELILEDKVDPVRGTATAIFSVLNQVQDFVAETMGEPWPTVHPPYSKPNPLPEPHVIHEPGRFRLLYGSAEDPVLELESVADDE